MHCEAYEALLMQELEGSLAPEEAARLRAHEAVCPACAGRRRAAQTLLADLAHLAEEEPELPADFHRGWMDMVEEDARMMQKESRRPRRAWLRGLSAAAALVFLVGGTWLTRDRLSGGAGGDQAVTKVTEDAAYAGGARSGDTGSAVSYAAASLGEEASRAAQTNDQASDQASGMVIRTVSLTLGTADLDQALEALQTQCQAQGGYVSYLSRSGEVESGDRRAYLTLRLPAEGLDAFLNTATGNLRVLAQTEAAEDVTAAYQDTAAYLATQQAKLERLQALMAQTGSLSELLELESALAETQYAIDSLQAQLNQTQTQVRYATVDVSLREERASQTVSARELGLGQRLLAGLETGWQSLTAFGKDMLVFLSAALPYLALLGLGYLAVRLMRRRKRERKDGK